MSKRKQIVNIFLIITIVCASCYIALFSLNFFLGGSAFLEIVPLYIVEGHSMEDTLYEGDLLLVKGVEDISNIKLGDIIVFYNPYFDKLIVHRVIDRLILNGQVELITKGDNNAFPDNNRVNQKNVIGIVIVRVPIIGSVIIAIQSPIGMLFSATFILIVVGVNILYDEDEKESSRKIHL